MESIQNRITALNVWHIKDDQTIGINWVKGNIHQWAVRAYLMTKHHILWRDNKLEIDGGVERNEYGATVNLCIVQEGKKYFHCFSKYKWMGGSHSVNTSKTDPLPPAQCDPPKKSFNSWVN